VLARQGKAPLATLRQLHESRKRRHSGLALVHLGLALKLMGDETRARSAIEAGIRKPRAGPEHAWWGDYGSNLRDWAMIYSLLEKHQAQPEGREDLVSQVAGAMASQRYYSTQEQACAVPARAQFRHRHGQGMERRAAGRRAGAGDRRQGHAVQGPVGRRTGRRDQDQEPGKERLFVELTFTGNPLRMPAARRDAFDLQRDWFTADGQPLGNRPLRVGETAIVRLQVKTAGRHANGLVVDHLPAGLEIENANIVQGEQSVVTVDGIDPRQAMQNSNIRHVEFRDDRFVVAARLAGRCPSSTACGLSPPVALSCRRATLKTCTSRKYTVSLVATRCC
jgi:uncharacterized protein YfaS (alpha-2-macroglobulin family)